ncbi:MAG: hypothetical protein ISS15_09730 [Alphaproteobacteria bacterium]|nr:hypothetical protein [Alphaproteobacteria bacterium]MBL7097927.1 hypothetical protein [Alphaproteobacteria bacterium]
MSAAMKEWKVQPHGPLVNVADNIITAEGEVHVPAGTIHRRMTIVRLHDGRLVVWSAVSLDEDQMRSIERFGRPAYLIVPNPHHRMDARAWKDRYPAMRVIAPEGARDHVAEVVPVDATTATFEDPDVNFVTVPGTKGQEAALEIMNPNGVTLVLNDIIANIRDAHGFSGWMLKLMGFAGDEPHVPVTIRMILIENKRALALQLLRWAGITALRRIIVSHGEIITDDPRRVLRELAVQLGI